MRKQFGGHDEKPSAAETRHRDDDPARDAGRRGGAGKRPDDHVIVLFGASGDLTARKLLPGFFHLDQAGLMPENYRIVGNAEHRLHRPRRVPRPRPRGASSEFSRCRGDRRGASRRSRPRSPTSRSTSGPTALDERRRAAASARSAARPRLLHYLAVPPAAFSSIVTMLGELDLTGERARVILEKPFGHDYDSAVALNETLHGGVRRLPDLPDRPLPRQGGGAEHPRAALRQRPLRAALEPQPHRVRPDRRARRRSRSAPAPASTRGPAPTATWSSPTSSSCSGSSRWSRPRRSTRRRCARRRTR